MVMSYLLTQVEMENALCDDYDSIATATKTMVSVSLQGSLCFCPSTMLTLTLMFMLILTPMLIISCLFSPFVCACSHWSSTKA